MEEKAKERGVSRRERNWQRFTSTGRVEDYLRYAGADNEFAEELTPDFPQPAPREQEERED